MTNITTRSKKSSKKDFLLLDIGIKYTDGKDHGADIEELNNRETKQSNLETD